MITNKLLRHQVADFIANQKEISSEIMDLLETISLTYDYFEKKWTEQPAGYKLVPAQRSSAADHNQQEPHPGKYCRFC